MLSARRVVWQGFARTKWAFLSLLLGFGGAWVLVACVGEIGPTGSSDSACPTDTVAPPVEQTSECASPGTGCKRFYLPLLGNPSMNPELRAKYKAAFGSACYLSADAIPTFNCWYRKEDIEGTADKLGQGCKDAKKIGEVSGLAIYDQNEKYKCQFDSNTGDFTLQVGPDVANKIDIKLGDAPLETSLIDVDGGAPLEVNGPYRNLVEVTTIEPGKEFNCTSGQSKPDGGSFSQKDWILEVNRKKHGTLHSDLAGFEFPCKKCGKLTTCTEKTELKETSVPYVYDPDEAQVHHCVRAKDLRGCFWGTNAYKNAVVISGRLNQYLKNKYPSADEVNWVNKVPLYTP